MPASARPPQISSLDIESPSSDNSRGLLQKRNSRVPRAGHTSKQPSSKEMDDCDEPRYYGGLMKSGAPRPSSQSQTDIESTHKSKSVRNSRERESNLDIKTPSLEDDSIADFQESEWTPQDSAYGAACPVCGCIPKHVRRLIEFSLIAGMVLGIVYLLVKTSIHISDRNTVQIANSTNHSQVLTYDDQYGNDQNTYVADDDALASYNDDVVYDLDDYQSNAGDDDQYSGR